MKKVFSNIWKLIKRHKLLTFICTLAIILVITMMFFMFSFFVGGNNKYGDRLKEIEKVKISTKKQKEIENILEENAEVSEDSYIRIQGGTIIINLKFNEGTTLDKAKEIANNSLTNFEEKVLNLYDVSYFLTSEGENSFKVTGNKKAKLEKISWIKS